MELDVSYRKHFAHMIKLTSDILTETDYEVLVCDSGSANYYFADDQETTFRPTPHFSRWTPLPTPNHKVVIEVGQRPKLLIYIPRDYWHDEAAFPGEECRSAMDLFDYEEFSDLSKLNEALMAKISGKRSVYLGPQEALAKSWGTDVNATSVVARLDWHRAYKTEYEIACMAKAQKSALLGHQAAHDLYFGHNDCSELEIHVAFLSASRSTEADLPYGTIVALNQHARVLHYRGKSIESGRQAQRSLLIDAGTAFRGYASDITRTYAGRDAEPLFKSLLVRTEQLQSKLVEKVRPKVPFVTLHETCHRLIADVLIEIGVIKGISQEGAVEQGLTQVFFPHGLGHHLGLQVHDVGGKQRTPEGDYFNPPTSPMSRHLRTLRTLEASQVITIEPGIYFIPMLLEPVWASPLAKFVNRDLVEHLSPYGGIRIEDDVLVTEDGHINLTRTNY